MGWTVLCVQGTYNVDIKVGSIFHDVTTDNPLDNADELSVIFRLPADVVENEPELAELHLEWIDRLRSESRGIPMHTVQEFILERIATKYVMLRYRELHGGWVGVNSEKDAHSQWLDLVKEWNKVLAAGHEQLRDAVLQQAEQISREALELIEDDETRRTLRRHFKERFASIGY